MGEKQHLNIQDFFFFFFNSQLFKDFCSLELSNVEF